MQKGIQFAGGLFLLVCAAFLTAAFPVWAARTTTLVLTRSSLSSDNTTRLSINFEIGRAQVKLARSIDNETVVRAVVTTEDERYEPILTADSDAGWTTATFASGYNLEPASGPPVQQWDITLGDYDIDTLLAFFGGSVTGDMDLGGLPLRSCTLTFGGSDMDIDFSDPTTRRLEIFMIVGGDSTLRLHRVGNTDYQSLGLISVGNQIELDLSGDLQSPHHFVNQTGTGDEVTIALSPGTGVMVQATSLLTALNPLGSGWQKKPSLPPRSRYVTEDYDSSDTRTDINITAFSSRITLER